MTTKHEIKKSINTIIREKGRFPSPQEMCNALNFSESQTRNYMQALYEDGYLEKIGDWYKFPELKPVEDLIIEEDTVIVEEPVKRGRGRPVGTTKEKIEEKKMEEAPAIKKDFIPVYGIQIWIIQIVMAIIGVGASIISIYYTSIWLIEFLPIVFAVLLSSIMTAFAVSAFETAIIFLSGEITDNKWIKGSAVTGFAVLWVVVTFFSIISTVAGQVNEDFKKKEIVESKVDYNKKQQWSILQDEKKDLQVRLQEHREQSKIYTEVLSGMNTLEKREDNKGIWWDTNNKLRLNQNNMTKILQQLDSVREKERTMLAESKTKELITEGNIEKTDFYQWLSKVLNIRADRIQFLLVLLPAVFCDLIAPVGIAVTLFLRSKKV
jgi:hypothetical protein